MFCGDRIRGRTEDPFRALFITGRCPSAVSSCSAADSPGGAWYRSVPLARQSSVRSIRPLDVRVAARGLLARPTTRTCGHQNETPATCAGPIYGP
jgi:hypothetical protein